MTTKEELQGLLERVEQATGPDREIDLRLWDLAGHPQGNHWNGRSWTDVTPYTDSIDAALALVERLIPGLEYEVTNLYGVASASLPMNDSMLPYEVGRNECGSIPLAILAAMFKALISKKETE